ncbi:S-adenosyl methyltransferase [Lentzea albidocapillata subsp. violacea]|uniref:S-adenosyl methyltransferase n=1 Tax=Lentzea albidocapillata subsp. violacea TaxID=128104 RepID=A0A1G9LS05_9PSEU|nr:SAM-dependent methyltransferase [Lentzea albidocapillata]SDL64551.1 S-adenosyl methyltransferase [Lentzea albidocapillata subsp. violacea]
MERPDWAPPEVDIEKPSIARVYDYWVGGTHNFAADREVAKAIADKNPLLPRTLRSNRAFLRRAVRELTALGVDQFLDIGSGIPTRGNVHEIAQEGNPDSRVVYVDIDPVAAAHGRAILAGDPRSAAILGDLRKPHDVLAAPETTALLDFSRPVGLIMAAVLHFVPDSDDPAGLLRAFADRLAPGSYVVISHAGMENKPKPEDVPASSQTYLRNVSEVYWRDTAEVTALVDGLDLLEPGVVPVPLWRCGPDGDPDGFGAQAHALACVARKN